MTARLAYDVDRWTIYQHRAARALPVQAKQDSRRLKFEDELFDRLYSGEEMSALSDKESDAKLAKWARDTHAACEALPAFTRLAEDIKKKDEGTRAAMAGLAVEALMEDLWPLMKDAEGEDDVPKSRAAEPQQNGDKLFRAVRNATNKAQKVYEQAVEADEALDQFDFGMTPGASPGDHARMAGERARQIANQIRNKPRMKRLVAMLGRFKRIAASKMKQKTRHGFDEIADVTLGDDIARFLPSEAAKLLHPVRKLALLRDMMEHNVLQYQITGNEPKGKGPMVVCLDKSLSMSGSPNDWATAVAMALGDVAAREKRVFAVLSFDTHIIHEAVVRPGEQVPAGIIDVAIGGGTRINVAFERALEICRENPGQLKKADIVFITDGGSNASTAPDLRKKADEMGIQTFGMAIGVSADCLKPWCQTVETIEDVNNIDDKLATNLFAA